MSAAEQVHPPVQVTIGERTFTLRLTLRAIREITQRVGSGIFSGGLAPAEMYQHLGTLLWALLRHNAPGGDSKITIEQLEDMVEVRDLPGIQTAIEQVLAQDNEPKPEGEQQQAEGEAPLDASSTS